MAAELYEHQKKAVRMLKTGSILCGGVGSGKSRTAIAYFFETVCGGELDRIEECLQLKNPRDLYIITTARKRDLFEWERECSHFLLSPDRNISLSNVKVTVDSWHNIKKYESAENAFFVFDEQRLVGSGAWVKSFLKITKKNPWLLLSATPGDTWMDYIPVFVANGFYKNRTEFIRSHVVYDNHSRYPKIDHYVQTTRLMKLKTEITVYMEYKKPTTPHEEIVNVHYDEERFNKVFKKRWNVFNEKPIKNISEMIYIARRVVNTDQSRLQALREVFEKHKKIILFYNFDYELELLREFCIENKITIGEWNGHKHETIPKQNKWLYAVQYMAGAEGWNCVETNCIVFYSANYSYRMMVQAAGRIDRLNTLFVDLYYYHFRSTSVIDVMIAKSLKKKQNFNENSFIQMLNLVS